MKRLHKKSELLFAIVWISLYVVSFGVSDYLSGLLGIEKIITAPLSVFMVLFLFVWTKRNGLSERYGLKKTKFDHKKYLFFVPLMIVVSVNVWTGLQLRFNVIETVLFVVSMLCVGFLEETIFRGFLFKALCKENVTSATIISSVTFGIGHIINLFGGAELISTLLQICYAIAIGFLFTIIFYKSGSLWPCIVAHSLTNALSAFSCDASLGWEIAIAVVLILLPIGYALWICFFGNKTENPKIQESYKEKDICK